MSQLLLQRLRRDEPDAVEEAAHRLLPFAQAALLARAFACPDPTAVRAAFKKALAANLGATSEAAFGSALIEGIRTEAEAIPRAAPDPAQGQALAVLARLQPMAVTEREWVVARFVARLPAAEIAEQFGVQTQAVVAALSWGVTLLAGGAAQAASFGEPSLADPQAAPIKQLVELENLLSALAIDVTGAELPAAVPVLRVGAPMQAPAQAYPSVVKTQAAVDLPLELSARVEPGAPMPTASELTPLVDSMRLGLLASAATTDQFRVVTPEESERAKARGAAAVSSAQTVLGLPKVSSAETVLGLPKVSSAETVLGLGAVSARAPGLPARSAWGWWLGGVGCGLLGLALYGALVARLNATGLHWSLTPVLVAARDLPEGQLLTADAIASRSVPSQFVTGAVLLPETLDRALGQRLAVPLQAGDTLFQFQFASKRVERLARLVARKRRAFSINVSDLKQTGGWARPGETVDVVLTVPSRTPGPTGGTNALTLVQDVTVLAVGAATMAATGPRVKSADVSLLLFPEEAEVLWLAKREGTLTLTLRAEEDRARFDAAENTTAQTLLDAERLKALERHRAEIIAEIRRL